jgi:hypothetical protein
MPLMPAFRRRKTSAAIVGRLLAGYGELEFLLAFCVGAADAARIAPKPGQQAGAHRWYHERQAIQDMFRERGESKRFNRAKKRMNKEFAGAGLKGHYIETMGAMHQCLKIRNLFAHCHWTQSRKRGLFFIDLEDAAVTAGPLRGGFEISCQACSSSSKSLASFKSRVSKPSVNQPKSGARRSRASSRLP